MDYEKKLVTLVVIETMEEIEMLNKISRDLLSKMQATKETLERKNRLLNDLQSARPDMVAEAIKKYHHEKS